MTNVTALPQLDPVRASRAAFVKAAIDDDDRSLRYVAGRMGINHTSLRDRVIGKVAFTAEDIEGIALVLKRNPVDFFREYLAAAHPTDPAGTQKAPTPKGEGQSLLPEMDSNHQPAG